MKTNIAVHGAGGRMGCRVIALGAADPDIQIVDAVESPHHPSLGKDAGLLAGIDELGVLLTSNLNGSIHAVIDFSNPAGASAITAECTGNGVPLVMATTGLTAKQQEDIQHAAETIPVVWAPNMSLTVNLAMKLAEMAGSALAGHPSGCDVEILERHHRFKKDAPSGTALKFGELIAAQMGQTQHTHGRSGDTGERPRNEIGYHAIRTGDDPGQHTIVFGVPGETLEIKVGATNRDCYAAGAIAAAKFLVGKKPGLYNMYDVLGFNQ